MIVTEHLTLHGHRVLVRRAGEDGPAVILLHGITGSSEQWEQVMPLLAQRCTVIAPDLLGHGLSAKPRGDYSLGAYASGVRDIAVALGHERATVVGHSLGGGIAMQFAYQFPERTERLVLMSSGGLGRDVHVLLRAATLPGSELVLPLLAHPRLLEAGAAIGGLLARVRLRPSADVAEMLRGHSSLVDAGARSAFIHTLRAVIDPGGQRVSAMDRLYLAASVPSLLLWGTRDPIIPAAHGEAAHRAMPGSRLELLEGAGHFPQIERASDVARILLDFLATTEPADLDPSSLRDRVLAGPPGDHAPAVPPGASAPAA